MNLAIEYLHRSGDIQNFLRLPCSLFLENIQEERIVVCMSEVDQSKVCITRWFLHESKGDLPPQKKKTIKRDAVFESQQIVLPGFEPLKYQEEPIPTGRNRYNRPMDEATYDHTIKHYLNSRRHRQFRENWLWKVFCGANRIRTYYNLLSERVERDMYGIVAIAEQKKVEERYPTVWDRWREWKEAFLIESEVASELIFSSFFASLPRIFLYGAEDMP